MNFLLPAFEHLAVAYGPDGLYHAAYPSATATLCGRPFVVSPGTALPDCGSCSRVARRLDRIDGSMPDHWKGL